MSMNRRRGLIDDGGEELDSEARRDGDGSSTVTDCVVVTCTPVIRFCMAAAFAFYDEAQS